MTTTTLQAPPLRTATATRPATAGFWPRLWTAMEAQGHRRAAAELRRLAIHHQSANPEMAQRLHAMARESDAKG